MRHAELADAIDRRVVALAGDAPVRFGQAPKRLRVYRTVQPFPKLATAAYRLPGDQPDDKLHKVEILGAGQQFVACGIHPVTGLPYAWLDVHLLDLEWLDLPEITPTMAATIIATAEAMLARFGKVASSSTRAAPPLAQRRPGPPRPVQDLREARRVLALLRDIDPSPLDYDTWVAVAYGLKAALGHHGYWPWMAWSGRSTKNVENTTERTWRSVRPERCGWRYLQRIHDRLVADALSGQGHRHG